MGGVAGEPCRFRVLGPVRAFGPGVQAIGIRSVIRRRLLAILLSRPFTDLTADALMDQMWGEEAPLDRGPLHVQVSRLRRELGGAAHAPVVVTVPGGYRLQVDRDEIDWLRFVDLVARSRALSADDPDRAASSLARALSLWSGPAFEDALGLRDVDDQARYLDALRRSASLELAGLAESLGRFDDAIDVLAPMHADEPFDEDVASLLAQAHARGGRPDRAMAVIAETTDALRRDLGIASSPRMRALLEAIRRRPDDVDVAPPQKLVATPPSLALPMAPPAQQVIGRARVIRALGEVVDDMPGPGFVQLLGPGGSGKTTVAVALAHELRRSGHSVRFATCTSSPSMVAVGLRSLFADLMSSTLPSTLGPDDIVPARETALSLVDSLADRLDGVGTSGPMVVIADDVSAGDSIDQLALRELARMGRGSWHGVVVVTARAAPWPSDEPVHTVELGPLTAADIAGAVDDPELAAEIHRITAGQPLAVGHVLERLRSVAPGSRAAAVDELAGASAGEGPFSDQIERRSARAAAILEVLVVAGHPVPRSGLAAVLGEPEWGLGEPIAELIDDGLAFEGPDGSIAVAHDLVAEAVSRLLPIARRDALRSDLVRHAGDVPDHPGPPGQRAGDDHIDLLVAAAQAAVTRAAYDEAVRIADVVADLTTDASRRMAADQSAGSALVGLEDPQEAATRFERARRAASALGDDRAQADAVMGLLGNWNAGAGPAEPMDHLLEESLLSVREPSARALLLARAVNLHLGADPRCRAWAEEAEALAASVSDPVVKVATATATSYALLGRPGPGARLEMLRAVDRWGPERIGVDRALALLSHQFVAACESGRLDLASSYLDCHRQLADGSRRPVHRWRSAVLGATLHMARREPLEAREQLDGAVGLARRYRLTDGRMTDLLARSALAIWSGPLVPGTEEPMPWISQWVPFPIVWAIDAAAHAEESPSEAASALAQAIAAVDDLPRDYLYWATIAATAEGARRLGEDATAARLDAELRSGGVVIAVVAMGAAAIPVECEPADAFSPQQRAEVSG